MTRRHLSTTALGTAAAAAALPSPAVPAVNMFAEFPSMQNIPREGYHATMFFFSPDTHDIQDVFAQARTFAEAHDLEANCWQPETSPEALVSFWNKSPTDCLPTIITSRGKGVKPHGWMDVSWVADEPSNPATP